MSLIKNKLLQPDPSVEGLIVAVTNVPGVPKVIVGAIVPTIGVE